MGRETDPLWKQLLWSLSTAASYRILTWALDFTKSLFQFFEELNRLGHFVTFLV